MRAGYRLRYGLHGLLAIFLFVGAAAAWQMLDALDGKADALTRHFRVDAWTTQAAEIQTYQLLHTLTRHVAGGQGATVAEVLGAVSKLRSAVALLDVGSGRADPVFVPGSEALASSFSEALNRIEALIGDRTTLQGDLILLARIDALLMPRLQSLRHLASSLSDLRLALQDKDSDKVDQLLRFNRWLLLMVVAAAALFIGLLGTELVIARRAEASARADRARFQDFAEIASDWLFETDARLRLGFVSEQVEASTGLPASRYLGRPARDLFARTDEKAALTPIMAALQERRPFRDIVLDLDDGQRFLRVSGKPVLDEAGAFKGYRGIGTDISPEVKRKERIRFLAEHDALTGLYNRSFFQDRLRAILEQAGTDRHGVDVLVLDLDGFKDINDTFGHDVGDALIVLAAERLQRCLRADDLLARLGGDEFAIARRPAASNSDDKLADRLLGAINAPMRVQGFEFVVGTSIGVARYPEHGASVEDLMKAADLALYGAKARGRNRALSYRAEMSEVLKRKRRIEADLRQALDNGTLDLHVQPQVDLRSERLTGGEALVRWHHPELGPIGPGVFIPIAEETGLILPLGRWVLETACSQAKRFEQSFCGGIIAVNVSPAQFTHQDLVEEVASILGRTGLAPENLELEITEGVLMRDHALAVRTLDRLHEMGVKLAIDDFGTGYSSLSYLKRFRVHKVKIDRAFVGDLEQDQDDRAIVHAVIMMSKALGFETLAEGVETAGQRDRLLALGCGQAQGYYYGKPCPIVSFFEAYGRTMRPCHPLATAPLRA